jgi:signal transduction histidine kinase
MPKEVPGDLGQRLREHQLESEIVETIEQLPADARHSLLRWMGDTVTRLDQLGEPGELASVEGSFNAVESALQRERNRIARELHDSLAADLATAVALFKHYFETTPRSGQGDEVLRNIFEILEGLLANTRSTLRSMRPRRLGTQGLVEELRRTAEEYGRMHGIRVELWTSGMEDELTPAQREMAFHIVREALSNVRRHSGSSVARVRLDFAAKPFMIEVADEGRGFDSRAGSGYGLVGMRERAAGIGARLEVISTAGKGTRVYLFGPDPR